MRCSSCERPLSGPDRGCTVCGRSPLDPQALRRATDLARDFASAHRTDPWLRSAALLGYSLRSRRRGFLDDPARPFTRAALRLLHALARLGGEAGVSPLTETAIQQGARPGSAALARALLQLLELHRGALADPEAEFEEWLRELERPSAPG